MTVPSLSNFIRQVVVNFLPYCLSFAIDLGAILSTVSNCICNCADKMRMSSFLQCDLVFVRKFTTGGWVNLPSDACTVKKLGQTLFF